MGPSARSGGGEAHVSVDMIGPDPYGVLATMSTKGRLRKNPKLQGMCKCWWWRSCVCSIVLLVLLRCCSSDRHSLAVIPCWCRHSLEETLAM
jgi:hypothetical protein